MHFLAYIIHLENHHENVKAMKYQSHSHYDSHAATVSQHEFIHNEKISMGKTGCNRTKKSAVPSKKKCFHRENEGIKKSSKTS